MVGASTLDKETQELIMTVIVALGVAMFLTIYSYRHFRSDQVRSQLLYLRMVCVMLAISALGFSLGLLVYEGDKPEVLMISLLTIASSLTTAVSYFWDFNLVGLAVQKKSLHLRSEIQALEIKIAALNEQQK